MDQTIKSIRLFGNDICVGDRPSLTVRLLDAARQGAKSIFFCNVHMLMLSREDPELAAAMSAADIVFADGVPVAWLQKRMGVPNATVLRGYEAVELICAEAVTTGRAIGFLGSTGRVLDALKLNLEQRFPGLAITYAHSPGKLSENTTPEQALVDEINAKGLYCLFVGLGCPKQEKWVAAHAPLLGCNLLAVGAAFDWLAGTTSKPPAWMEKTGLGWLYRLVQNPRKMWRRYLIYNTKFIFFSVQWLAWGRRRPRRVEEVDTR